MHPVVGVHEVWALRERVRAFAESPRVALSASWVSRSVRAERRAEGAAGPRGRRCAALYRRPRAPRGWERGRGCAWAAVLVELLLRGEAERVRVAPRLARARRRVCVGAEGWGVGVWGRVRCARGRCVAVGCCWRGPDLLPGVEALLLLGLARPRGCCLIHRRLGASRKPERSAHTATCCVRARRVREEVQPGGGLAGGEQAVRIGPLQGKPTGTANSPRSERKLQCPLRSRIRSKHVAACSHTDSHHSMIASQATNPGDGGGERTCIHREAFEKRRGGTQQHQGHAHTR